MSGSPPLTVLADWISPFLGDLTGQLRLSSPSRASNAPPTCRSSQSLLLRSARPTCLAGIRSPVIRQIASAAVDLTAAQSSVSSPKRAGSLGDVLPDDVLVEVGDQGLGCRDRGEAGFLGRTLRRRGGLWNGLGSDLGEGSGCAEGADAGRWIEAALKEWKVRVEAEIAARRLVGHGTPGSEAYQDHLRWAVEYPPRWCQLPPERLDANGAHGTWRTRRMVERRFQRVCKAVTPTWLKKNAGKNGAVRGQNCNRSGRQDL